MMLQKMASIDAQMRLLVPKRVSEDDKLIEYDALLLDRFLDVLEELHGIELKDKIQNLYELAGLYSKNDGRGDVAKLQQLVDQYNELDPGDNIVVASSFSHMLNLGNLAEEVQIAYRRRVSNAKKGDIGDENSALTESDMEETFQRLLKQMKKSPQEIYEALKDQTVDLVLTAHPTQSVRRSLLQKHSRIRSCLSEMYQKDILADEKKELDESLQREIQAAFRTDEIRRSQPTPQDEMRAGMSYFHETIWNGLPKFLRRVDTALNGIGVKERLPHDVSLIQFSSWMGGDRDGRRSDTCSLTISLVLHRG